MYFKDLPLLRLLQLLLAAMCTVSAAQVVDDSDTVVVYNGAGWSADTEASSFFNGTTHATRTAGDSVSLIFFGAFSP